MGTLVAWCLYSLGLSLVSQHIIKYASWSEKYKGQVNKPYTYEYSMDILLYYKSDQKNPRVDDGIWKLLKLIKEAFYFCNKDTTWF